MKKYWIKDLNSEQAIHAPTLEIAHKLCEKFHDLGMEWQCGDSYLDENYWWEHNEDTCYIPSSGTFAERTFIASYGYRYEIITIDQLYDFDDQSSVKVTEKDLIGDIKGFPIEVVQKMVERQVEYAGEADIESFQECKSSGFIWSETPEGVFFLG